MFKIIISNPNAIKYGSPWVGEFETQELAQEWLKKQIGKPNRLPEREVEFKEDIPQDQIKEIKEVVIDNDGEKPIIKKVAILKAECTVEIKNLNEDVEFLKQQAISNRIKEYPSQFELNEALYAFFDKDESKIMEVLAKRKSVDEKYPLPQEDKGDIKNVSIKREI